MPIAPTTVPIIRNEALRSEAPSTGWQIMAAVVAAHEGSLSSSSKATYKERQTEAHILRANRNAGVAACNHSAKEAPADLLIEGLAAVMGLGSYHGEQPAIDIDDLAVHVIRGRRGEEHGDADQVIRLAPPSRRRAAFDPGVELGVVEQPRFVSVAI